MFDDHLMERCDFCGSLLENHSCPLGDIFQQLFDVVLKSRFEHAKALRLKTAEEFLRIRGIVLKNEKKFGRPLVMICEENFYVFIVDEKLMEGYLQIEKADFEVLEIEVQ